MSSSTPERTCANCRYAVQDVYELMTVLRCLRSGNLTDMGATCGAWWSRDAEHDRASIGRGCVIDETAQIHETATVGHYCVIGAGVVLGPEVRVANYTIIDAGAQIGEGTAVWNWVHIREEARIGPNCSIGDMVHIGPACRLGHSVRVGNGTQIHHPAIIGDRAWIAPAVFLSNDARPNPGVPFSPQPVCVGDGAIIGAQCEVRGGVSIGAQAAVGMGSTVTRDVPPGALAYGVAAAVKRGREEHWPGTAWAHYGPLDPEQHCPDCDRYMARQWKDREQA